MIEITELEKMFESIRSAGQWNMTGPMLWGYFFTDPSDEKLRTAAARLESLGYRYVAIYEPDLDEGEEPYFFLHVEQAEVHSVESLYLRNCELTDFAEEHGLATFDGMDVGPVPAHQYGLDPV